MPEGNLLSERVALSTWYRGCAGIESGTSEVTGADVSTLPLATGPVRKSTEMSGC